MSRRRKRKNSNITRPFDGNGHLSLMLRTVPGNPTGNDLSPFCDEISKDLGILVIDIQFFIGAESADLSPQKGFFLPIERWFFSRFFHPLLLYLLTLPFDLSPLRPEGPLRSPQYKFAFFPLVFASVVD